jgi:adenine-specific DNA methylase
MSTYCRKLIEVALPIREISAESVRDKSLRHGHISTLHLWWARRPLAAARAVTFASLVPDPDDALCPPAFRDLVAKHLRDAVPGVLRAVPSGKNWLPDFDPYKPFGEVPDTLRNRLLAFVAKWSRDYHDFDTGRSSEEPKPEGMLDPRCLAKWEASDTTNPQGREVLRIARELVRAAYDGRTPVVLDPFSGGGSIPLEAGRVGAQPIANDYNPVAYLILRSTCEFPQTYGRPGRRLVKTENSTLPEEEREVPNVLVHDVDYYARIILEKARTKIGHLYPSGKDGAPVVGYLWARTAPCSNPSCRGTVPLLRSMILCDKPEKKYALTMEVDRKLKRICFGVAKGKAIEELGGTMIKGGSFTCPYCDQVTPVQLLRQSGIEGKMGQVMTAAIVTHTVKKVRSIRGRTVTVESDEKTYRPIEEADLKAFAESEAMAEGVEKPQEYIVPEINAPDAPEDAGSHRSISTEVYGIVQFHQLYNARQLVAMQTLIGCLHELKDVPAHVQAYLALWLSRISLRCSNVGVWHTKGEKIEHPFGRQAIAMVWDYPEANIFSEATGGALGQLDWIARILEREGSEQLPARVIKGDAAEMPIKAGTVDCVVTDPPYFDAIAYADLSDYMYVWLKRAAGDAFPEAFNTPQTPKSVEIVAHKHRHHGDRAAGKKHFEDRLSLAFTDSHRVLAEGGVVSIMFAHQSSEAWSALINAVFRAGLTITATYPIDTEMVHALKGGVAALSSSITVTCRERVAGSATTLKEVQKEIRAVVKESVARFWAYGFRGADLIVACYGPAVGVFGQYERVERADGRVVEVPELLEMARLAARDAIAGEFRGDNLSTLYYVWANLYGAADTPWDDAVKIVQMGGDSSQDPMEIARAGGLLIVDGASCRLALLSDRADRKRLGEEPDSPLIDCLHRAMMLWKSEQRAELVRYLVERDLLGEGPIWKLTQGLFEVLPRGTDDWKLVSALLAERDTLRAEARRQGAASGVDLLGNPVK